MNKDGKQTEIARTFFDKAYHLQMRGYLDRAAHFYRKSIEMYPTAKAHTFLGWVYSLKGLYIEAIEECKKAIELDPAFGNPYNDIGAYLIQLKRYSEAKQWIVKALHAPKYENYCFPNMNMGIVLEIKGDWDKARYYYGKALEENPEYQAARTALDKLAGKYN